MPRMIIAFIFLNFSSLLFSQELRWSDLMNCNCSKINVDPNQQIDCNLFFEKYDSCVYFGQHLNIDPIIVNRDSVMNCIHYPESAKTYKISGIAYLKVLIDKSGKVYCSRIYTDLGEAFILETERISNLLKFNPMNVNGKPLAYTYILPITFNYESNQNENHKKKQKNTGTNMR